MLHVSQVTIDLIDKARERILDPSRFCTQSSAQNTAGKPVDTISNDAVRWCIAGASFLECYKLDPDRPHNLYPRIEEVLSTYLKSLEIPWTFFTTVNDEGGHEAAIALLDHILIAADQGYLGELS